MVCIVALCSCDRDKSRPASSRPSTSADSDLLDLRPRAPLALERTIHIVDYPLKIRVPEQWMLNYGGVNILEGPTPNGPLSDGRIHLIVSRQGPISKVVLDSLKPASRPATAPSFELEEMRMLGKMKVYERRSVQPAAAGVPAMMKWTIGVYQTLDNENVRLYQISFLDLTREHFEKDRQLLEAIVKSLDLADETPDAIK